MSAQMTEIARVMKPSNRRPARTRTVSTRVTEAEYIALQKQAWSTGKTVCDWARECIVQQLEKGSRTNLEAHLFTELVGIQLLLMNTLGPILRGERMAAEEVDVLFRQVQTRKAGKAQEILNKRLSRELEGRGTQPQTAVHDDLLGLEPHLINAYPGNIGYKLQD
jgi:hypothetical protein